MISPDQIIKFVTYRLNDKRIDCWPVNLPNLSELIQPFSALPSEKSPACSGAVRPID